VTGRIVSLEITLAQVVSRWSQGRILREIERASEVVNIQTSREVDRAIIVGRGSSCPRWSESMVALFARRFVLSRVNLSVQKEVR